MLLLEYQNNVKRMTLWYHDNCKQLLFVQYILTSMSLPQPKLSNELDQIK